jgi:DNA repair photolyase
MEIEIREVPAERCLNPTSIDLGEYVINPYRGCAFGCLYCYARCSKKNLKDTREWGTYVDVRVNLPELLEKELFEKKPGRVLLGSTTECFQPAEKKYRLTENILKILNARKVRYSILTRSPDVSDHLSILGAGYCESIYFTVNDLPERIKAALEPFSPATGLRIKAIQKLHANKINVIPYYSPFLPFISLKIDQLRHMAGITHAEFEMINLKMGNITTLMDKIGEAYPHLKLIYERLLSDDDFYKETCLRLSDEISSHTGNSDMTFKIHISAYEGYFKNSY